MVDFWVPKTSLFFEALFSGCPSLALNTLELMRSSAREMSNFWYLCRGSTSGVGITDNRISLTIRIGSAASSGSTASTSSTSRICRLVVLVILVVLVVLVVRVVRVVLTVVLVLDELLVLLVVVVLLVVPVLLGISA